MDKQSESNRADRERATTDAQAGQADGQQYAGGNAMLDAQIQSASVQSKSGDADEDTVANVGAQSMDSTSNISNATKQGETTGNYPADLNELEDQGDLSLQDSPAE